LCPEIEFPSQQQLNAIKGLIPEFPNAIGSLDLSIQKISIPSVDEW
jgi:hypothetical protein